jgi:transcriptional regulator with XRE-family HTH domain
MSRWRGMPANGQRVAVVQRDQALAAAVRRLRMESGVTQERLALDAEVTIATLSRVERGVTDPHWTILRRILTALGVNLTELAAAIEDETPEEPSTKLVGSEAGVGLITQ